MDRRVDSRAKAPAPFQQAMIPFGVARSVTRLAPSGPVDGAAYMPDASSRSTWVRASGAAPLPGADSSESRASGAIGGLNGGAAPSEVSAETSLMLSMPSSQFAPSEGAPASGVDSGISRASGAISGRVGGASAATLSSAGAWEGEASLTSGSTSLGLGLRQAEPIPGADRTLSGVCDAVSGRAGGGAASASGLSAGASSRGSPGDERRSAATS